MTVAIVWSPSAAREALLALAMARQSDGARNEAEQLRKLAREDRLVDARSVVDAVALIVGPTRAAALRAGLEARIA